MIETIEEILEEYKDMVKAKASMYFMLGSEKEDLLQEGMIGLVKAYNTFDESKGSSFKTYAQLLVNHQLINAVKTAERDKNAPLNQAISLDSKVGDDEDSPSLGEILAAGSDSDPESQIIYSELLSLIVSPENTILSELEIMVLKYLLQGYGYKDIAEKLEKSPKQIDNAIQRIKGKINILINY